MTKAMQRLTVLIALLGVLLLSACGGPAEDEGTGGTEPTQPAETQPEEAEPTPEAGDGAATTPEAGDGAATTPEAGDGAATTPEEGDGAATTPEAGDGAETTPEEGGAETTPEEGAGAETTPAGGDGEETELGETSLKFGQVSWTDCEAMTAIATRLLEDEGYTVDKLTVDPGVLYQSLAAGEVDAMFCSWQPVTHSDYLDQFGDQLVSATTNMEGLRLGWAVPSYVQEINSIEDLPGNSEMFNGRIVGIDPGAGLMRLSNQVMEEYNLKEEYELLESSDSAMVAELDSAISQEEPIVVTSWKPHMMWVKYDLTWLEDPKGVLGEAEHSDTMTRQGFKEESPRAFEILSQITIDPDVLAEVMLEIQEGTPAQEAANNFVDSHPDLVAEWTQQ